VWYASRLGMQPAQPDLAARRAAAAAAAEKRATNAAATANDTAAHATTATADASASGSTSIAGGSGSDFRCRVSSNEDELERLHRCNGWVPGRAHVRPTPEVRAQKEMFLSNQLAMWASPVDFMLHLHFGVPASRVHGRRQVAPGPPGPATPTSKLAPNPYPYDLPPGTEHHVLWMLGPEWDEQRVTAAIAAAVDAAEPPGGEFVWYSNPKKSVPDPECRISHVQVFWRRARGESA